MSAMLSAMIASLSLAEKVSLNQLLAASLAADFGSKGGAAAATGKATKEKKAKKEKDPNAPKKAAAPGVLAWNAFVKHCKTTQPELFTGTTKESERLAICGGIKTRDTEAYEAWVKAWLADRSSAPSEAASEAASEAESEEAAPLTPAQASTLRQISPGDPKVGGAAPVAEEKPKVKKLTKKEQAAAAAAAAALAAAAAAAEAEEGEDEEGEDEEGGMVKKTIAGINYLMDPESLNLYKTNASFEDVGAFAGKFVPATGAIDTEADE